MQEFRQNSEPPPERNKLPGKQSDLKRGETPAPPLLEGGTYTVPTKAEVTREMDRKIEAQKGELSAFFGAVPEGKRDEVVRVAEEQARLLKAEAELGKFELPNTERRDTQEAERLVWGERLEKAGTDEERAEVLKQASHLPAESLKLTPEDKEELARLREVAEKKKADEEKALAEFEEAREQALRTNKEILEEQRAKAEKGIKEEDPTSGLFDLIEPLVSDIKEQHTLSDALKQEAREKVIAAELKPGENREELLKGDGDLVAKETEYVVDLKAEIESKEAAAALLAEEARKLSEPEVTVTEWKYDEAPHKDKAKPTEIVDLSGSKAKPVEAPKPQEEPER